MEGHTGSNNVPSVASITDDMPEQSGAGTGLPGPTPKVYPPPESLRPTVYGERYVVSAGHPLVAQVASDVLTQGGNAIDAGVAAGIASGVVQPDMCNLGGIAPIMVRPAASDQVFSVAGVGWWGSEATIEGFRARYGEQMPSGAAVGLVPAALSAYIRVLQRFGTWSFSRCAAPAIALASEGFVLDQRLAESLEIMGADFRLWEDSAAVYWPEGRPPRAGERLVQAALGRTLERLADAEDDAQSREAGLDAVHDAFYRGEIAETISSFCERNAGWLTVDDLASFDAEIEPGVMQRFREWSVWTPTTWCQGPALLQALAIVAEAPIDALEHNSTEYIHLLVEAIKLAFGDREDFYGDPRFVDVPLDWLLSPEHTKELHDEIDSGTAGPGVGSPRGAGARRLDTTYLCAIDAEGNAFSATPSDTLDSAPVVPELGLIVSPRGLQSRLDPDHPAALAPRKRPRVTPSPGLAIRDRQEGAADSELLAIGCPGGDVILQAMLQSFLNVTVFSMTPQQAVEAPRFVSFGWPDSFHPHATPPTSVALEGRIEDSIAAGLDGLGHDVQRWDDFAFDAGGVAIAMDAAPPTTRRVLAAGADPRRIGYALGR
jgi:gamma-glutamyltranspeptidase/glutathione hydrolase